MRRQRGAEQEKFLIDFACTDVTSARQRAREPATSLSALEREIDSSCGGFASDCIMPERFSLVQRFVWEDYTVVCGAR